VRERESNKAIQSCSKDLEIMYRYEIENIAEGQVFAIEAHVGRRNQASEQEEEEEEEEEEELSFTVSCRMDADVSSQRRILYSLCTTRHQAQCTMVWHRIYVARRSLSV
jgi:hypothetical protein